MDDVPSLIVWRIQGRILGVVDAGLAWMRAATQGEGLGAAVDVIVEGNLDGLHVHDNRDKAIAMR